MLQIENDKIKDIYVGSDKIKEVYYESEKVWGGAVSEVSEVDAFMTAATLSESYRTPLNILVSSLISNNLWEKLLAIYPFCGSTWSSLKYNLKDPRDLDAAYRLALGTAGTLSYALNAVIANGNIKTFLPSSILNPDSLSLSILSETNNANSGRDFTTPVSTANNRLIMSLNYTGGLFYADLYNAPNERVSTTAINNSTGFFTVSRASSASLKAYRNGSVIASNTNTRTNTSTGDLYISGFDKGSITYRKYTFACIGAGLTDEEASILYDIVTEFRNSII